MGAGVAMNIPGIAASHQIITDVCRTNRTGRGALEEAFDRIRREFDHVDRGWPVGSRAKIHLVLAIEQPSLLVFVCPQCKGRGEIDDDQYHGRVSILCQGTGCTYHETKDWSKELPPTDYMQPGVHEVERA
jgi:hypothetical protein